MSSSNRFNRGKQISNQTRKFPTTSSSSHPFPSSTPKPGTSKQVQNNNNNNNNNRRRNPSKKKETKIWVKKESIRNWLELPLDVMLLIFLKLGLMEHVNAESVCSSWRDIARDPFLYRRLDTTNPSYSVDILQKAITAVDRSCGQLADLSLKCYAVEILQRVVEKSCRLRRLRLEKCNQVSDEFLVEVVKKMPSLEVVEICMCSFSVETIEAVGRACPELKSFRFNRYRALFSDVAKEELNKEALAIAGSMPGLRSLHLSGNLMSNKGFQAILDKCPHLEYLDLRQCLNLDVDREFHNVDLDEDLSKQCKHIKTLRLPKDSIEDYEFEPTILFWESEYDEYYFTEDSDDGADLGNQVLLKAPISDDGYDSE